MGKNLENTCYTQYQKNNKKPKHAVNNFTNGSTNNRISVQSVKNATSFKDNQLKPASIMDLRK